MCTTLITFKTIINVPSKLFYCLGKAAQKSIKKERASALNENLDDLVAQLAETTPQDIIEATTYAPTTLGEPYGKFHPIADDMQLADMGTAWLLTDKFLNFCIICLNI